MYYFLYLFKQTQLPILTQFHTTPSQQIWPLFAGCGVAVGCLAVKHIVVVYETLFSFIDCSKI